MLEEAMEVLQFPYLCVIDFEATCRRSTDRKFYPHEIIEFPAVLINTRKQEIVSTFHSYVRPFVNPTLTTFCKDLTGISQEDVDNAYGFDYVILKFTDWLQKETKGKNFKILTDGPYDMGKFLYLQCLLTHIPFPSWAEKFIDIKVVYKMYHKSRRPRLVDMMETYGLTFEGQLHSGKDDANNIARLALVMMDDSCYFGCNSKVCDTNKKYLERQLAAYFRRLENGGYGKKRGRNKKQKTQTAEEITRELLLGQMDVDPDLIGFESVILKRKSK